MTSLRESLNGTRLPNEGRDRSVSLRTTITNKKGEATDYKTVEIATKINCRTIHINAKKTSVDKDVVATEEHKESAFTPEKTVESVVTSCKKRTK